MAKNYLLSSSDELSFSRSRLQPLWTYVLSRSFDVGTLDEDEHAWFWGSSPIVTMATRHEESWFSCDGTK